MRQDLELSTKAAVHRAEGQLNGPKPTDLKRADLFDARGVEGFGEVWGRILGVRWRVRVASYLKVGFNWLKLVKLVKDPFGFPLRVWPKPGSPPLRRWWPCASR